MSKLLKNKVAIITGGSRGIGKAISQRFAQEGCNLILVSRTESELQETAKSITKEFSVKVNIFSVDISDENKAFSVVRSTIKEFGKISILVNNAAIIGPLGEISNISGQDFFDTLKNNIGGTVFFTKAVIPHMKSKKEGCIINLSGGGGLNPFPYYDAYSASKAAIVRLTENFALELEEFNIKVNAISPGAVNTKLFRDQLKEDKESIGDKNWLNLQDQLSSGGESIHKASELALFLACQEGKELSGRVISAIWDNWKELKNKKEEIDNTDIYKMRRIVPKYRDQDF